jgi:secretion/DNA translocation related TadE-like protein
VSGACRERGSASIWVIACCALLLGVAFAATLRTAAVVARHRAESAADLAALSAAGQIGISQASCPAAARIAAANGATVQRCVLSLALSGRSGTVTIAVSARVRLPIIGVRHVVASARAGRQEGQRQPCPLSGVVARWPLSVS